MTDKNGLRYCDRCGVILTRDNNKCGYELCDKCNEWLEEWERSNYDTNRRTNNGNNTNQSGGEFILSGKKTRCGADIHSEQSHI